MVGMNGSGSNSQQFTAVHSSTDGSDHSYLVLVLVVVVLVVPRGTLKRPLVGEERRGERRGELTGEDTGEVTGECVKRGGARLPSLGGVVAVPLRPLVLRGGVLCMGDARRCSWGDAVRVLGNVLGNALGNALGDTSCTVLRSF